MSTSGNPSYRDDIAITDACRYCAFISLVAGIISTLSPIPSFATLLGYGMGMILVREYHRKNPYKRILARRYAALAAMGLIHFVFLFFGDIMSFW